MSTSTSTPVAYQRPAGDSLRKALATTARPPRPNAINATLVHGSRSMMKFKHGAAWWLVEATFMPVLTLLMFTYLFGGAFAGSTSAYLQYIVPGVLVMTVVFNSVTTGAALNTDITKGIFDRFRTLPFWQPAAIIGAMAGDVVRHTIALTTSVLVGMLLGFRPGGGLVGVVLAVLFVLLFALSLGWIFTTLGVVVKSPESISSTTMVVLFPLVFTSNIFVESSTMPAFMRAIVENNPVSHAATAARGLMHGSVTTGQMTWALLSCVVLTAIFAPLTMYLYARKNKS